MITQDPHPADFEAITSLITPVFDQAIEFALFIKH